MHIVVKVFQFKEFHKSNLHPKGGGWALGSNFLLKIISTHSNPLQMHFKQNVIEGGTFLVSRLVGDIRRGPAWGPLAVLERLKCIVMD